MEIGCERVSTPVVVSAFSDDAALIEFAIKRQKKAKLPLTLHH